MGSPASAPANSFTSVTPSDSVDLNIPARSLYVGGAGDVACINGSGVAVTFVGVTAGTILPIRTTRVNATNTTATSIVSLE